MNPIHLNLSAFALSYSSNQVRENSLLQISGKTSSTCLKKIFITASKENVGAHRILNAKMPKRIFLNLVIITLFALLIHAEAHGQANLDNFQKMVDILPPPPNASAITKAALFNLNKNTGAPNINIPIFTLTERKLSVPVSISYNSNGIKVDEIASRVGMGWSLNAGGVITRTVRGKPDEVNTRRYPYAELGFNGATYNYMKSIVESNNAYGYDSEPDMFSFSCNGLSGSFVFDETMGIVQIPFGNLKIESNFTSTDWNFKIIDENGISYFFGGNTATEKTKRTTSCGKNFDDPVATAWYLKKIVHLNGDIITFAYSPFTYSYDTGISETMIWAAMPTGYCVGGNLTPPAGPNSICKNKVTTYGVTLEHISSANQQINFIYINRSDCEDKLVSEIKLTDLNGNHLISRYALDYYQTLVDNSYSNPLGEGNYTPYLSELYQFVYSNTDYLIHRFTYNQRDKRPSRISFSQDHWGFFNGKYNTTLIPKSDFIDDVEDRFPNATADREIDSNYTSIGMLTKITYPTGGMDSILYEPNKTSGYEAVMPYHEFTCSATGSGEHNTEFKEMLFVLDNSQKVKIDISVICNSGPGNCDPIHQVGKVEVLSSTGAVIFTTTVIQEGTSWTETVDVPTGANKLRISANGTAITTNAKLKFYRTPVSSGIANKLAGGLRVKALLTTNGTDKPMIKRYFYGELENLDLSSALELNHPKYHLFYDNRTLGYVQTGGYVALLMCTRNIISLHSNSLMNLVSHGSNVISYQTVVESNGENFEGGGILTKYYAMADRISDIAMGKEILNAPSSNRSIFNNGKIREEWILKKVGTNIFPLKKSITNYQLDSRGYKSVPGYTVNQKYSFPIGNIDTSCMSTTIPSNQNFSCYGLIQLANDCYDMARYDIISPWNYVESTEQIMYDENGQNPLSTITNYFYENEFHQQITRTESYNSKDQLTKTIYTYPHDYPSQQVYDDMVSHNIITAVVDTKNDVNGSTISEEKTNFAEVLNNNYVPVSIESSVNGNPLEIKGTLDLYSDKGSLLQYTDKTGIITSMVWGYNRQYPVAKIIGSTYLNAIAQLTNGNDQAIQAMDNLDLKIELNKIRTNLPSALVTTYSYKPMVGITSITDANNKTNSYEYDGGNRLKLIRDQNENVVRNIEYNYELPATNKPLILYFNEALNGDFKSQVCLSGFQGTPINYSVPAKKHYSIISQIDANTKAQADLQTFGQINANRNGSCSNLICTGNDYKLINCFCQQAIKACITSIANGDGTWTNTFRYQWSDGSYSSNFTEILQPCIGVNKKKIGCKCETGFKIYTASYKINETTWECTFHYHWSDGSSWLFIFYTCKIIHSSNNICSALF